MLTKKLGILTITAALGAGAAFGVAACGEDRDGEVQVEGETGGTGTSGTGTAGTATAPTTPTATAETSPTETVETVETAETETAP